MAITGIDTIDGKQIIAAGAISAKSAEMAYNDENGNPITSYLTAVPEGYATTGDLTAYQTTAGMTAYQSAGDYYSASNPSGFITGVDLTPYQLTADMTAYQPIGDYQPSGDYVSATELVDYQPVSSMTAYQSAGDYLTTADSANFYTTANESGFISEVPAGTMNESAFEYDASNNITAYNGSAFKAGDEFPQSATEAIETVTANSGNWETVTAKLDTTAFSDVSGTFLTAHQDISNKLDTTAFSDVSGSFLTAVPDTYLQNTDLSTEGGKVTAISGIPLSAGGSDVPEGVMVESGLEYNAVNEISGYNGSAIAQYGAEKQWLQHDDTLVHAANSAQYALGVNLSAVAQLLGVDETVLWSGNAVSTNFPLTLNEPMSSFDTIKFYWQTFNYDCKNWTVSEKIPVGSDNYYTLFDGIYNTATKAWYDVAFAFKEENEKLNYVSGAFKNWNTTNISDASGFLRMFKIVGIGRKA